MDISLSSDNLSGHSRDHLTSGESAIAQPIHEATCTTCSKCGSPLAQATMSIEAYRPRSTLVLPENHPTCARYPFIDVHSHQDALMPHQQLDEVIQHMNALRLQVMVNLNGGFGDRLRFGVQAMNERHPGRFAVFANVDFSGMDAADYPGRAAEQFEADVRNGAQGLKIFKNLGMDVRDRAGSRIRVDDPRFDNLFEVCASLRTPVLIHTADPKPFFETVDEYNERWLELKSVPTRWHPPDRYPRWQTLIDEQHRLFARHPRTVFINAHLGWLGGDLTQLAYLLDQMPNVYTEFGAVIAELGRQPRHARDWFIRYQDRVLFGKDSWCPAEYHTYFRVLETADEYFDHHRRTHGLWKLYGLDLPDEVLRKVYYENALRVLPHVDPDPFRATP